MSRTLSFVLNGFPASVSLPDHFFDERGIPRWHVLNSRFGQPFIVWNQPIGAVPVDDDVEQPASPTKEELKQLQLRLDSLEKKIRGHKHEDVDSDLHLPQG